MKIKIHRGAKEIGGSCVEISSGITTILVDLGLPLDFDGKQPAKSCLTLSLQQLFQKTRAVTGVLLFHPHIDHYGLAGETHYQYLHTSGHARINDLKAFVNNLAPKKIIPIHSFYPECYQDFFKDVQMIEDGEEIKI
jgi:mRNA degradation ribonuclease J1/J2